MSFLNPIIAWLESLAGQIPLAWFVIIGSFIEEIIAPIPSPLVMTSSGSIAASQHMSWVGIVIIAIIAALAKTVGSVFIYMIADKGEDVVIGRFGKYVGISHKEVEYLGRYLNKGWRDDIVLFLLRAIPIVPTAPVSVLAGVIKLNMRTYIVSSFLGTIVRNIFYLYVGFAGLEALHSLQEGLDSVESLVQVGIAVVLVAAVAWIYYKRQQETGLQGLLNKLQRFFK